MFSAASPSARVSTGTVFPILLVVIGAMGYVAPDRTRGTRLWYFSERVQTLTGHVRAAHHPG